MQGSGCSPIKSSGFIKQTFWSEGKTLTHCFRRDSDHGIDCKSWLLANPKKKVLPTPDPLSFLPMRQASSKNHRGLTTRGSLRFNCRGRWSHSKKNNKLLCTPPFVRIVELQCHKALWVWSTCLFCSTNLYWMVRIIQGVFQSTFSSFQSLSVLSKLLRVKTVVSKASWQNALKNRVCLQSLNLNQSSTLYPCSTFSSHTKKEYYVSYQSY